MNKENDGRVCSVVMQWCKGTWCKGPWCKCAGSVQAAHPEPRSHIKRVVGSVLDGPVMTLAHLVLGRFTGAEDKVLKR